MSEFVNFERAFSTGGGGCRRQCACGKWFYNPDGGWTWEDGEIEKLEKSSATPLPYPVGSIDLEGVEYCMDCDCWHERARKITAWINNHAHSIAEFLSLERERKQAEADNSPTVRTQT